MEGWPCAGKLPGRASHVVKPELNLVRVHVDGTGYDICAASDAVEPLGRGDDVRVRAGPELVRLRGADAELSCFLVD